MTSITPPSQSSQYLTQSLGLPTQQSGVRWVEEALILGPDGVVCTKEHQPILETAWRYDGPTDTLLPPAQVIPPAQCAQWGTTGVIGGFFSDCYFHWMFDLLPKAHLLAQDKATPEKLFVGGKPLSFKKDTLQQLGIEEVLWGSEHASVRARAVAIAHPGHPPGLVSPWVISWLRESFLDACVRPPFRRLYLTRAGASQRQILNEDELLTSLLPLGFQKLDLATLPVKEQARLFAEAEIVVAPHGAGLTNLAFCQPGTQVVELFPDTYQNPCYERLSQMLHLDYQAHRFPCQSRHYHFNATILNLGLPSANF